MIVNPSKTPYGATTPSTNPKLPTSITSNPPLEQALISAAVVIGLVLIAGINNGAANAVLLLMVGLVLVTAISTSKVKG